MFPPKYDSGDHLHASGAGYQAMANAINLHLLQDSQAPATAS
jgi:lysophospholipase L1-like esterase